jgi:hypothetical protein
MEGNAHKGKNGTRSTSIPARLAKREGSTKLEFDEKKGSASKERKA